MLISLSVAHRYIAETNTRDFAILFLVTDSEESIILEGVKEGE